MVHKYNLGEPKVGGNGQRSLANSKPHQKKGQACCKCALLQKKLKPASFKKFVWAAALAAGQTDKTRTRFEGHERRERHFGRGEQVAVKNQKKLAFQKQRAANAHSEDQREKK